MKHPIIGAFGLTTFLLAQAPQLIAQPEVDITLADNGHGQLELRVRPNGPFNGLVSNVVLTMHWAEEFGSALSLIEPLPPMSDYLPFGQSALVNGGNGQVYRTLNSVGLTPMSDFDISWEAGQEYPVCTIEVLVPGADVSIENDGYTLPNNRNYYCSLNGAERTGAIFESAMPLVNALATTQGPGTIDVSLTPEADYFGWVSSVNLPLRWPTSDGATLGALGQDPEVLGHLPMEKIGSEVTMGGYTYQRFRGEGLGSLANLAHGWPAQVPQTIMSIPVSGGPTAISVVNDANTPTFGGDYEVFLNGRLRSGSVQGEATAIASPTNLNGPEIRLAMDGTDLDVALTAADAVALDLAIHDMTGRVVWSKRRAVPAGPVRERIDMGRLNTGAYIFVARSSSGSIARRFVR